MQHVATETETAIRALAHQFWLEEGRPEGRADIHWQRALANLAAVEPVTLAAAPAVAPVADVPQIAGKAPRAKAVQGKTKKR